MSKPKNICVRDTAGSKIDKHLLTPPQASGVAKANTASAASIMTAPNTMEGSNSEIRNMNQGLKQQLQKVGDDMTTIKVSLDFLKAEAVKLSSRTSEAEARISQLEDVNTQLVNTSQSIENKIAQLQTRIEYQENYSRRNNIRFKGLPERMEEGQSVNDCVKDMLQCLFAGTLEDPTPTSNFPPDRRNIDSRPRHILARFLRLTNRERVQLRAKELGQFQWKGSKVDFSPDFSKEVQDNRNKFTEVRCMCMKRRLRYSMQYPAVFWVTAGGKRHPFEDVSAARKFVEGHHPAEEAE